MALYKTISNENRTISGDHTRALEKGIGLGAGLAVFSTFLSALTKFVSLAPVGGITSFAAIFIVVVTGILISIYPSVFIGKMAKKGFCEYLKEKTGR